MVLAFRDANGMQASRNSDYWTARLPIAGAMGILAKRAIVYFLTVLQTRVFCEGLRRYGGRLRAVRVPP